ncbi:hypothetical protein P175DRAFT_0490303 [Aspergillus ochraceoroseus IBT 24754]|uniref:Uncharacterized protein n=1 Tax=Aspergillus ochraceoroseus IBT 24754 TaxID=1392256 RepID=A0A2T5M9P8_9EURO|nr:uncharacterized protein P175DRAFT_0490303 [Aspergillus ochraceoroseus IBT 24754]PTU25247.1 hypothetical protein P175DRAFT_0490303 [Aspergillus ochraceoroseus IBT 24754]
MKQVEQQIPPVWAPEAAFMEQENHNLLSDSSYILEHESSGFLENDNHGFFLTPPYPYSSYAVPQNLDLSEFPTWSYSSQSVEPHLPTDDEAFSFSDQFVQNESILNNNNSSSSSNNIVGSSIGDYSYQSHWASSNPSDSGFWGAWDTPEFIPSPLGFDYELLNPHPFMSESLAGLSFPESSLYWKPKAGLPLSCPQRD